MGFQGARAVHVSIPSRHTFAHAKAAHRSAESVFFELHWAGERGVGECVPRPYVTGESISTVLAAVTELDLREVASRVLSPSSLEESLAELEDLDLVSLLRRGPSLGCAAACAVELALLDRLTKLHGVPLREIAAVLDMPDELRAKRTELEACIGLSSNTPLDRLLELLAGAQPHHIKVKVGVDRGREDRILRELRARYPSVPISVDANMAWSLDEACEIADAWRDLDIAWFEEPLAARAFSDCARLRQRTGARVMVDESLCSMADARAAIEYGACDLFNLRISKVGGFVPALRMAELALPNGVRCQAGVHPFQHGVLWASTLQLGVCFEELAAYEGTGGTDLALAEHPTRPPPSLDRQLYVASLAALLPVGIGVEIDDDVVARCTLESREL